MMVVPSGTLPRKPTLPLPLPDVVPSASSPYALFEVVVVQVGDQRFAVDVEHAVEIRGAEVLLQPDSGGDPVLPVRGQPLPVIDLRQRVGMPAFGEQCPAVLLVNAGPHLIALAVDAVLDVETLPVQQDRATGGVPGGFSFCRRMVTLRPGEHMPLIDTGRLLAACPRAP
ncbi:chemotaxis protein CheW [Stenotrophomonas sp. NPDC077659]|uniref:chemotaxis protein CheW n=1 Tax=Stenotrophomonas sp. NPDC077659 TaxID=3390694 RepID=UPI003D06E7DF